MIEAEKAKNSRPRTANPVVQNALAANSVRNASEQDEQVYAAYREGCRKSAAKLHNELMHMKAHVAGKPHIHYEQPDRYKKFIDEVLDVETALTAIMNWR